MGHHGTTELHPQALHLFIYLDKNLPNCSEWVGICYRPATASQVTQITDVDRHASMAKYFLLKCVTPASKLLPF